MSEKNGADARQSPETGPDAGLLDRLRRSDARERRDILRAFLCREASELLGLAPGATLDADKGLFALGMNSLMAVQFPERLRAVFGERYGAVLPAALVFNYPTIERMTEFLITGVFSLEAAPAPAAGQAKKPCSDEAIAIVGMGCRFPGRARDVAAYWDLLCNGVDAVREVLAERFDIEKVYDPDPDAEGKTYLRRGGFIEDEGLFDARFFGISSREARAMDPQQRLLLEVSWEALKSANEAGAGLAGSRTGVFVGCMRSEYRKLVGDALDHQELELYEVSGNDASGLAAGGIQPGAPGAGAGGGYRLLELARGASSGLPRAPGGGQRPRARWWRQSHIDTGYLYLNESDEGALVPGALREV